MLFGGGVIPVSDIRELKSLGVSGLFTAGTATPQIVDFVTEEKRKRRKTKGQSMNPRLLGLFSTPCR